MNVRENVRVSYNGGRGGIEARPTREEEGPPSTSGIYRPTQNQVRHEEAARSNRDLRNSVNHGRPPVTAIHSVRENSTGTKRRRREKPRELRHLRAIRTIRCIRKICPRINVRQLRIPGIQRQIRSTRSSRKTWPRNRINSGKNSSSNKIGSISSTQSRTPTRQEISSWNRSTRSKRSSYSRSTTTATAPTTEAAAGASNVGAEGK